jgi:Domain of unknown function (DUF4214)
MPTHRTHRRLRPRVEVLEDRTLPAGGPPSAAFLFTPISETAPLAEHIHPHLTIVIDGQQQTVPAGIGLLPGGLALPLHTHDATGTIHVESTQLYDFRVTDFFAIWGQPFDRYDVLGYHFGPNHPITVTVNGQPVADLNSILLHDHDNIIISGNDPGPGPTPDVLAGWLTHSAEYYGNLVKQLYQQEFKRAPDAAGLAFWVGRLEQGLTDAQLEAALLSSPDYLAARHGPGAEWLTALYRDVLGRRADQGGLSFRLGQLAAGATPYSAALALTTGPESETLRLTADFQTCLGRAPTAAELSFWRTTVSQGTSNEDVVAYLVGSPEYFTNPRKGQGSNAAWVKSAYQDILHRPASSAEVNYWVSLLPPA